MNGPGPWTIFVRFIDENSWRLDCVHKKETVDTLSEAGLVEAEVVAQV